MEIRKNYAVTALRWVIGWTYFSAFWRRLILENKLNPDEAGYIGEKFNHFLPHAIGIKPIIQYLVENPIHLWVSMWSFTIIEGVVGLCLILGLFTRLMSFGVIALALGILLGSGWIGTTCLDEWQIGVLGIAAGYTLLLSPLDSATLDVKWRKRKIEYHSFLNSKKVFLGSLLIVILTLLTNQIFHGGVWGKLHNKSVKPIVEIQQLALSSDSLSFEVYRVEGADVYGSFLIGIQLIDESKNVVFEQNMDDLSQLPIHQIHNFHVTKVKPGKHSLIIPLGAKAKLSFSFPNVSIIKGNVYQLVLTDISGAEWLSSVKA